jgi:hypothetical protein
MKDRLDSVRTRAEQPRTNVRAGPVECHPLATREQAAITRATSGPFRVGTRRPIATHDYPEAAGTAFRGTRHCEVPQVVADFSLGSLQGLGRCF